MKKKLLWIHGWGMSPQVWGHDDETFIPGFENEYISYAECESRADFQQVIQRKLAGKPGGWTIIGWSMGGILALEAFLDESLCRNLGIESVVIVSGTLCFVSKDREKGWPARVVERMRKQVKLQPQETLRQFAQSMFSASEKGDSDNIPAWLSFVSSLFPDCSVSGLEAGLTYLIETDLTARWEKYERNLNRFDESEAAMGGNQSVKDAKNCNRSAGYGRESANDGREVSKRRNRVPLLLWIHGEYDPVMPMGYIQELASHQTIIMGQAGHVPFITQKERFYDHLRSFLHA